MPDKPGMVEWPVHGTVHGRTSQQAHETPDPNLLPDLCVSALQLQHELPSIRPVGLVRAPALQQTVDLQCGAWCCNQHNTRPGGASTAKRAITGSAVHRAPATLQRRQVKTALDLQQGGATMSRCPACVITILTGQSQAVRVRRQRRQPAQPLRTGLSGARHSAPARPGRLTLQPARRPQPASAGACRGRSDTCSAGTGVRHALGDRQVAALQHQGRDHRHLGQGQATPGKRAGRHRMAARLHAERPVHRVQSVQAGTPAARETTGHRGASTAPAA